MSISKGIKSMDEAVSDAHKFAKSYGDTVDSFQGCIDEIKAIIEILKRQIEANSSSQDGRKG